MDNILVFGHSVTQGMWDDKGGWVQRLENHLISRALKTQNEEDVFYIFNEGVTGDTTVDLLNRLETEFWNRTEDEYENLLIIQIGDNDAIEEDGQLMIIHDQFKENIRRIAEVSQKLADEVVFVGDFPVNPDMDEIPHTGGKKLDIGRLKEYEEVKKDICREEEIKYIDLFELVEDKNQQEFLEEGLHPNPEGHKLIFQKVKKELEAVSII